MTPIQKVPKSLADGDPHHHLTIEADATPEIVNQSNSVPAIPGSERFEAIKQTIGHHRILGKLNPEQIDLVAGMSREARFKSKQLIFRAGEPSTGIFLLTGGFVKLARVSPEGKDLLMGLAGPHDLFGSCCQPMVPKCSPCLAEARSAARAVQLPTPSWEWLLKNRPQIAHVYLEAVLETRSSCSNLAPDLALLPLGARLAKILLYLSQWSTPNERGEIEIPRVLSQRELASAIGTAREVVTRKLQELVDEGFLIRQGRQIILKNKPRLVQVFERTRIGSQV